MRSKQANEDGSFDWEMAPVTLPGKAGDTVVKFDEQPFKAKLDKIPGLKPAFKKDGTITAANASSISDGAAALVLMRESTARQMGLKPIARIAGHAVHAQAPDWFTTAPVGAIQKVLKKAGWQPGQVDLWEVNEAFAAVTMAAMTEFKLPHEIVNVHGGACALGHPIGASGARIVVTLLGALRKHGKQRGVAALCIGGGEATALAVEMLTCWRAAGARLTHRRSPAMLLPEDHRAVQDAVRAYVQAEVAPHAAAWDKSHAFPAAALRGLAGLGCYGVAVPAELGRRRPGLPGAGA